MLILLIGWCPSQNKFYVLSQVLRACIERAKDIPQYQSNLSPDSQRFKTQQWSVSEVTHSLSLAFIFFFTIMFFFS